MRIFALAIAIAIAFAAAAHAQTYTMSTTYSFGPTIADGETPVGGLVLDAKGNVYGVTQYGGYQLGGCDEGGCGTVFKLDPSGKKTTLHQFTATGNDGALPNAGLAIDKAGNLYGTTVFGGVGFGVVFKITPAGKYSTLHAFGRTTSDGRWPLGPVTLDSAGNLYGTTSDLNTCTAECPSTVKDAGYGVIWKLSPKGVETLLYAFGINGSPVANVIRDGQGNLYGAAFSGWSTETAFYGGVLFKLPAKGSESTLYTFCSEPNCADGVNPSYTARDSKGNFFALVLGTETWSQGAIAKVTPAGVENLVYQFCTLENCQDGGVAMGPLLISGGNLYGTAADGGTYENGVVWELTPSGTETVLYSFINGSEDGYGPASGIVTDSQGNLYGTAQGGEYNLGVVWKLTKN